MHVPGPDAVVAADCSKVATAAVCPFAAAAHKAIGVTVQPCRYRIQAQERILAAGYCWTNAITQCAAYTTVLASLSAPCFT